MRHTDRPICQPATPLEEHIAYYPACLREECAVCGDRICSGDTYYVDPDCMPICAECARAYI